MYSTLLFHNASLLYTFLLCTVSYYVFHIILFFYFCNLYMLFSFLYSLKEFMFSSILFFAFFITFNVELFPYPKVYTPQKFLLILLLYSFLLLYFHTLHSTVSLFYKIISYVRLFWVKGILFTSSILFFLLSFKNFYLLLPHSTKITLKSSQFIVINFVNFFYTLLLFHLYFSSSYMPHPFCDILLFSND